MKRRKHSRIGLLCAALVGSASFEAWADFPSNPYDAIVSRNPFGLRPPPPPPETPDESANKPPTPLADVTVTGITSILGKNLTLLEIIPAPGKPTIKPILGEGERVEGVEVVAINLDKNEVTIKNGTVLTNLTFKVAKSAPAPTGAPPPPGVATPFVTPPAVPPPAQTSATPSESGGRRSVMVAGGEGAGTPTAAPTAANPAAAIPTIRGRVGGANPNAAGVGLRSIPQRIVRPSPQSLSPAAAQTPEQRENNRALQYLQMIGAEQEAKKRGLDFPPTPPIPGLTE